MVKLVVGSWRNMINYALVANCQGYPPCQPCPVRPLPQPPVFSRHLRKAEDGEEHEEDVNSLLQKVEALGFRV